MFVNISEMMNLCLVLVVMMCVVQGRPKLAVFGPVFEPGHDYYVSY